MDVRLYDPKTDRERLSEFQRRVFGGSAEGTTEAAAAAAPRNPYATQPAPTAIAVAEGAIIGHLTSTPFCLWLEGREQPAHWVSGFHVLPEARGLGLGRQLVACLDRALPLASAVVVVEPSLRAFRANRWTWPGSIVEFVHVVEPRALASLLAIERLERFVPPRGQRAAGVLLGLLARPIGWAVAARNRLRGVPRRIARGERAVVAEADAFGPEVDELWRRTRSALGLTHVRSSAYLDWQFPCRKGWRRLLHAPGGRLDAWAVFAIKSYLEGPLRGLRALNVVDAFWDVTRPAALTEIVCRILALGARERVDLVLMSGDHPQLRTALRRAAFLRIPSTVHVGFKERERGSDFDLAFQNAYITRGYADAAGSMGL